jgi:DNA replication and repair protein RecF
VQLQSLHLYNFKNYTDETFHFAKAINCFTGENGAGKTNLLDAIYYLCLTKSYFNSVDQQLIRHGQPSFIVEGDFKINNEPLHVKCLQPRERKKEFSVNDIKYDKLSLHVGLLPVVMVTPDDSLLIYGGSEERRRFLDGTLSQINRTYLESLQEFNKLLVQRNALLKQFAEQQKFDANLLLAYDRKLVPLNDELYEVRKKFVAELVPVFDSIYNSLSGEKESVSLTYQSDLDDMKAEKLFLNNMEKDRLLRRTTGGIQGDDLIFRIDDEPVKKFGSQGQQKTFLLSLKLAQAFLLKKYIEKTPLLLLDDIFDKLDTMRSAQLLQYISAHYNGQIFITDTQKQRVEQQFCGMADKVQIFEIARIKVESVEI